MSQKNAVFKIATPGIEAEVAGQLYISKEKQNNNKKYSLENELVSNGWRYIQNDFKSFLNSEQTNTNFDEGSEHSIPEEEMDKLINICLEYAEVDQLYDKNLLRNSLYRVLTWDPEYGIFSYKAPEAEGSSGLIKESIDKVFFGRVSKLTDKNDNSKYRYYQRHLFVSEPPDESRKLILQFAYLLKMTSEDARTYLTKWSFADDIRWNSPWELAAAYEIECHPAREEDRASSFIEAIVQRIQINKENPNVPENREYLDFIRKKEQEEYSAWIRSYCEHCKQNQKEAFLCHWAWLLLASRTNHTGKRIVPSFSEQEIRTKLPALYSSLMEYVQKYISPSGSILSAAAQSITQEDQALQQEIINVMKNRHLRLVAAAYAYARLNHTKAEKPVELCCPEYSISYVPPQRELGFTELPTSIFKIENKFKAIKSDAVPEITPLPNRFSRSDVIRLGIELALTTGGINQLLTIGGFYTLYARDFFEYALKRTLYELESSLYTDGHRFAVKDSANARNDDDLDCARKELKEKFMLCLEENYDQLSLENRSDCYKDEPNWVKKGIRSNNVG